MHRRGASCIIGVYFWSQGWKAFKSMLLAIILTISGANQGQKVFKSMLLAIIFSTSGAKARKSSNRCSWLSFCQLLEPKLESLQIDGPGYHFVDLWSQGKKVFKLMLVARGYHFVDLLLVPGHKVFKSMFLATILSTSGAKARKSSNRCFWVSC